MSRNIDSSMAAALPNPVIVPVFMAALQFKSETQYVWNGIGPLVWNGQTFNGVGSLGKIGTITEGTTVQARGMQLSLSGIDPALYDDSINEIVTGLYAKVWFAVLTNGAITGVPLLVFDGIVDLPTTTEGASDITITLNLENRIIRLQRANRKLYTSAEQHILYPNDSGFNFVELLNDEANVWGG